MWILPFGFSSEFSFDVCWLRAEKNINRLNLRIVENAVLYLKMLSDSCDDNPLHNPFISKESF